MGLMPAKSYEDLLGDGLQALMVKGVNTLEGMASGLNELNVHGPNGQKWTPELLEAELARLGR
jgi:hypothetical protein